MIDHKDAICVPYVIVLYIYRPGIKRTSCVVGDNYKETTRNYPFDLTVGCMDTETNVVDNSGNLIIMSFFHGNKAVVAVDRTWITS